MNRRTFLSAATMGFAAATAGCLSGDDSGDDSIDPAYERCTSSFVPFQEIPTEEIRTEVEIALEEGEYAADALAYPELVAEDSTLWDIENNRYYDHRVHSDDSGQGEDVLTFEEVAPTRTPPAQLKLSNQTDDALDASVTIAVDSGEAVVDDELTVEPTDALNEVDNISNSEYVGEREAMRRAPSVSFPDEMRDYEITLEIDSSRPDASDEAIVSVTPWMEYFFVQVGSDGILSGVIQENDNGFRSDKEQSSKDGSHWECTKPPSGWPKAS